LKWGPHRYSAALLLDTQLISVSNHPHCSSPSVRNSSKSKQKK
jgi:hypothetical protein